MSFLFITLAFYLYVYQILDIVGWEQLVLFTILWFVFTFQQEFYNFFQLIQLTTLFLQKYFFSIIWVLQLIIVYKSSLLIAH